MADLDELALAMPQATKEPLDDGRPAYFVHGSCSASTAADGPTRSTPRASDSRTSSCSASPTSARKRSCSPTTAASSYDCPLQRLSGGADADPDLARIDRDELRDLVAEAWLTRAQKRVAKAWLAEQGLE